MRMFPNVERQAQAAGAHVGIAIGWVFVKVREMFDFSTPDPDPWISPYA